MSDAGNQMTGRGGERDRKAADGRGGTSTAPSTQGYGAQQPSATSPYGGTYAPVQEESPWASGLVLFAALMMIMGGVFQVLNGLAGIIRNTVYVAAPNYVYSFDLTAWGWVHLCIGVLVGVTGAALLRGMTWARVTGIVLVSLSLINNFLFIPYYPVWSLLIIAVDFLVIWALAAYHKPV